MHVSYASILSVAMTPSITSRKVNKFEVQMGNYNRTTLIISLKSETIDWRNHMFITRLSDYYCLYCILLLSDVRRTGSLIHASSKPCDLPLSESIQVFRSFNVPLIQPVLICYTYYDLLLYLLNLVFHFCVPLYFLSWLFCFVASQPK